MATKFEIDCSLMAGAVYISTRSDENKLTIPNGWSWSSTISATELHLKAGFEKRMIMKKIA
ncbi:MAG: hypothetical protein WBB23_20220 [Desulforhopalus sp.]